MKNLPSTTALPHSQTANGERRTANSLDERGRRSAFTLIEMLIVVVVIAILSGLVFQMVGAGGTSSDKVKARRQVEALANAVEEYHAEYGRYPPVARNRNGEQPLRYEYPGPRNRWTGGGEGGAKDLANYFKDIPRNKLSKKEDPPVEPNVFIFGLMSYLAPRVEGRAENAHQILFQKATNISKDQSHWQCENSLRLAGSKDDLPDDRKKDYDWNHVLDNARDVRAAKKIEPFIKDIVRTEEQERKYEGNVYTNRKFTVWDPWGNELHYNSDPPYDSYRIWSCGPDGKSGTADDIISGREN